MKLCMCVGLITIFVLAAISGALTSNGGTASAQVEVAAQGIGMPVYIGNTPVIPLYNVSDRSPYGILWNGRYSDCTNCADWTAMPEGFEFRFDKGILIVRDKEN